MVGGSGMCVPHACGTSCSECIVQVPGPAYLCLLHIMGSIDLWLYIDAMGLPHLVPSVSGTIRIRASSHQRNINVL